MFEPISRYRRYSGKSMICSTVTFLIFFAFYERFTDEVFLFLSILLFKFFYFFYCAILVGLSSDGNWRLLNDAISWTFDSYYFYNYLLSDILDSGFVIFSGFSGSFREFTYLPEIVDYFRFLSVPSPLFTLPSSPNFQFSIIVVRYVISFCNFLISLFFSKRAY